MIGIIYKFTIRAKIKFDGHKPFYIGQHWHNGSELDFLSENNSYWGSGMIWLKFINNLRKTKPNNWKIFIKREILYQSEKITQRGLDAMEAYYIKREKAHYSYGLGGCNVLWGTANNFGSGNPSNDENIKDKQRHSLMIWWKNHPEEKERLSKRRRGAETPLCVKKKISLSLKGKFIGNKNPMYGKKMSEETRRKMSISQSARKHRKPHSEHTKKLISESRRKYIGENHPLYGSHFIWINNGISDKRWKGGLADIPSGWIRGRIKKTRTYESSEIL